MTVEILFYLVPLAIWLIVAKYYFDYHFTWPELGIQSAVTSIVIILVFVIGNAQQTSDYEFRNGYVTETKPVTQNCPWGWRSTTDSFCTEYRTRVVKTGESCSTNSNGVRTCTPIYDTEYNYIYDWERRYFVETTLGQREVPRVDRQGVNTPERFSQISVNDPVAGHVQVTNYIKGAASSLFNEQFVEVAEISYPRITDIYKSNRVIYTAYPVDPDYWREWNEDIMEVNRNIRDTGANAIVVVTGHDKIWAEQLAQGWDAHNINDVIVVIGMSNEQIDWVDVRSWSNSQLVNIEIRDEILNLGTIDKDTINTIIETSIQDNYKLRDMTEFEYLADDIETPFWVYIVAMLVLLVITPLMSYMFIRIIN